MNDIYKKIIAGLVALLLAIFAWFINRTYDQYMIRGERITVLEQKVIRLENNLEWLLDLD